MEVAGLVEAVDLALADRLSRGSPGPCTRMKGVAREQRKRGCEHTVQLYNASPLPPNTDARRCSVRR